MSLFDNKSGQHVGDGSTAIQIAGNAQIGNTTTEVVTICELVVRAQMASLKEDAYKLVNQRATEFGNQIASKLSRDLDDKLKEKLSDPDIQYSMNQAVIQVARKGFNEKSELLKELIVSKIQTEEEDDSIVIDQALELTSKLTTNDIKFLSLIYYFRNIAKMMNGIDITNLAEENKTHSELPGFTVALNHLRHKECYSNYNHDLINFLGELESLKKINVDILSLKGVIFTDKHYVTNYQSLLGKRTGISKFENDESFYEAYPALKSTLDAFGIATIGKLNSIVLNPIGLLIAENFLRARNFLK
ncbi:LPO_1073/Vpar_1526 family protein [Klebsiella pneumoniae]